MIESDQHTGRHVGLAALTVTWFVLLADAAVNYGLAHLDLGAGQLPVALALAAVNLVLLAWFFMHLAEQGGARRMALPVGILYLLLLLSLTMLDVARRFPPVRPGGVPSREAPTPEPPPPPGGSLPTLPGR